MHIQGIPETTMKSKQSRYIGKPAVGTKKKLVNAAPLHKVSQTQATGSSDKTCQGFCATNWKPAGIN